MQDYDDEATVSNCSCLYSSDGDMPAFLDSRWATARKEHRCCECHQAIAKGERYEATVGRWDGEFTSYKTCAACQDIRQSLYCDGWTFTLLWEDVEEQIFRETGLTISCIDKLATAEGKAYLQQRWMEYINV